MDNATTQVTTAPEIPNVARAIRAVAAGVCELALVQISSESNQLAPDQLKSELSAIVEKVAAAVESGKQNSVVAPAKSEGADAPAQSRAQGLNDVVLTNRLLRAALLQQLSASLNRPLAETELIAVNEAMEVALAQSLIQYLDRHQRNAFEAQMKSLSKLSHDLRGGLNGMFLMIEMLKREMKSDTKYSQTMSDIDSTRQTVTEALGAWDRFVRALKTEQAGTTSAPAV